VHCHAIQRLQWCGQEQANSLIKQKCYAATWLKRRNLIGLCLGLCRSQQLAELLDLPTDGLSADPSTPKGQQTSYNGVYVLQHRQDAEAPKMSRFGTREQVSSLLPTLQLWLLCQLLLLRLLLVMLLSALLVCLSAFVSCCRDHTSKNDLLPAG
jgi:hypothetical protein